MSFKNVEQSGASEKSYTSPEERETKIFDEDEILKDSDRLLQCYMHAKPEIIFPSM